MNIKKYIAELIGTFVLTLVGCGVAAVTGCSGAADASYVLTALAFGGTIVVMAYSIGIVSGCHINPAVSLGMALTGRMSWGDFVGYVVSQFLGGIAAAAVLLFLTGGDLGFGVNHAFEGDALKTIVIEAILTFIFVLCVLGVTSQKANGAIAGLTIGGALTLVHLMGIYFTGTSVNPARSFGPALFTGGTALSEVWLFIVAPLVGGALAAVVYNALIKKDAEATEVAA